MDADRLAFLRDSMDAYLLRSAKRNGSDLRAMRSLALELISNYHDEITKECGGVPDQVARHLRNAGNAAQDNKPPVVARELDAALAVAERLLGGKGRGPVARQTQETKGIAPT